MFTDPEIQWHKKTSQKDKVHRNKEVATLQSGRAAQRHGNGRVVVTSLTLCSNRNQLHSFAGDEVQSFVDVGDLVDSHLASLRFGQTFTWGAGGSRHVEYFFKCAEEELQAQTDAK